MRRHRLRDVLHERGDVGRRLSQAHRAAFELRKIEQALDEAEQLLALFADGRHELALLAHDLPGNALEQHLAVADDRRERRAKLVRHGSQKVALQAIELLQPVVRDLKLVVLVLELAIALAHRREVHVARQAARAAR